MANIKIILRKEVKKDGTSPLAIRITKNRQSSYIYLEYSLFAKDWDEKNQKVKKAHPNSTRLNNYLLSKLAEANNRSLEIETTKENVSVQTVSQKIKPKNLSTLFSVADMYILKLRSEGKFKRWTNEKSNIKNLKEFLKHDISFSDLSPSLLERFKSHLISQNKVSERTAINNWVTVRSICSMAIKEGLCDIKYYPFGRGKLKIKFPDSQKLGLTLDEVKRIENVELSEKANHARNLWLISFYFAGIRVSDVLRLKWTDFQDGRLYYSMGKNNKGDSLKVNEKVNDILKQYKKIQDKKSELIFPDIRGVDLNNKFEVGRAIASKINSIDKILRLQVAPLAEISKPLTMHIARHTFGNISGDKIPIQMLQKLYRHSDIKTTIGYQSNFIHKDVDEALDAVING